MTQLLIRALVVIVITCTCAVTAGEPEKLDALAKIAWLKGDWAGVGEGEPGTSATERHVRCALGCRYLRINARSVYPRQDKNVKGEIHHSLDMWSFDRKRNKLVLRTFDNLGFTTTYAEDTEATSESRLVMVAEHLENVPAGWQARYTYTFVPPDEYQELFELDPNGKGFQTYVFNRFLRVDKSR